MRVFLCGVMLVCGPVFGAIDAEYLRRCAADGEEAMRFAKVFPDAECKKRAQDAVMSLLKSRPDLTHVTFKGELRTWIVALIEKKAKVDADYKAWINTQVEVIVPEVERLNLFVNGESTTVKRPTGRDVVEKWTRFSWAMYLYRGSYDVDGVAVVPRLND
jgi:hypothetical protein